MLTRPTVLPTILVFVLVWAGQHGCIDEPHLNTVGDIKVLSEIMPPEAYKVLDDNKVLNEVSQIVKTTVVEFQTPMEAAIKLDAFNKVTEKVIEETNEVPQFEGLLQGWSSLSTLGFKMSISFVAAIIVRMYYQVIWSNTRLFLGTVMASIKLICLRVILYILMEVESSSFVGDRLMPQPKICIREGYRCCFSFRTVHRTRPSCKAAVSAGERGSNSSSSKQMIGGMQNSSEKANQKGNREVAQMLKREERKEIAQQEENSSFPFYVMPRKKFLELTVIVTHEQALEESFLVILVKRDGKLYIDGTNTEVDRTQIVFFSQRWFSKDHPDNKNNLKLNGSQACLDNIELSGVYYVWFDLFSVPQAKDKKEEQLQAIMSLPYYVRNCYHFVTLLAKTDDYDDVKVMDEMKQFDKGSLETYDSRGWCRIEKLAASSPPIIVTDGNIKRLPAAKMWQYHINSETLDEWSFAFANANTVDPLKGSFSAEDVEDEKRKVAPMVLQLCAYIKNFSGVNQIRKHGANIQMLAETYAGLDEGFDVNT